MQNTTFQTYQIAASGPSIIPTLLARAQKGIAMRVLVRNVGGVLMFIGGNPEDVAGPDGPVTATYRLPPGQEDVFILAPEQTLYAVAAGGGGLGSVSYSEAIPYRT